MGLLFEPFMLFVILFLPGALGRTVLPAEIPESTAAVAAFSSVRELTGILAYKLPALALIWYLLSGREAKKGRFPRFSCRDLWSVLAALPALLLASLSVSLAASLFNAVPGGAPFESPPAEISAWVLTILSCLSTGYLEESFFRYYLYKKLTLFGLDAPRFILVSAALFSLCHLYEGPWGTLNACFAGLLLALIFTRFRALHGIALAHGLYNLLVYIAA
ncbi:MAG: CPBP family intramembrane metalloprotease [Treponema sp.]|jgi:membrane protease YdiL (CAAX protease family)|nr:CPBP family intramembrane metalloprotease [Treponema sp.]